MAAKRHGKNSAGSGGPQERKSSDGGFPIIGMGASAGGLEAFEQFFRLAPREVVEGPSGGSKGQRSVQR